MAGSMARAAAMANVCVVSCGISTSVIGRDASVRRSGLQSSAVALKWGQSISEGSLPRSTTRMNAWFKFGSNGMDSEGAGIYGSQKRDDFDRDDVEQYFNYMGMLASEGTYDKMEALLNIGIHPVDILLLLAASEGDIPKIEELLRAGADCQVKDDVGRTALDRARDEDVRELIISKSKVQV